MPRPRRIPTTLDANEVRALLRAFTLRYWAPRRNHALVVTMLACGLRCAEALALRWDDIDRDTGQLRVHEGKGGHDRVLWLSEHALTVLDEWHKRSRFALVFPTRKGTPLAGSYVREMMSRMGKAAGITKPVHAHMLRHTFATNVYAATKDIRVAQQALGHKDVRTTQIYTHVSDDDVRDALRGHVVDDSTA